MYAGYDYEIYAEVDVDDGCPGNNDDMVIAHTYLHDMEAKLVTLTYENTYEYCECTWTGWYVEPCDTVHPQAWVYNRSDNADEVDVPVVYWIDALSDCGESPSIIREDYRCTVEVDIAKGDSELVTFDCEWTTDCCCPGSCFTANVAVITECDYITSNDSDSHDTRVLVWWARSESLSHVVTIDGAVPTAVGSEWGDAYELDISDFDGKAQGVNPCMSVFAHFKNDCNYLYIAIRNTADNTRQSGDRIALFFDSDNNDLLNTGDVRYDVEYTATGVEFTATDLFTDLAHTFPAGMAAVAQKNYPSPGPVQYELKIPIGTQWYELNVNRNTNLETDTVGLHIYVYDAAITSDHYDGWWVQEVDSLYPCCPPGCEKREFYHVPQAWGNLIIHEYGPCEIVECVDIPMVSVCGWQMVSLPVMPTNKSVDAVFPDHCGVFTWDGDGYIEPDSVEGGVAYWVCYIEPDTITVCGMPVNEYTRSLVTGWSMIGAVYQTVDLLVTGFQLR